MSETENGGPVDRDVGRKLLAEGLRGIADGFDRRHRLVRPEKIVMRTIRNAADEIDRLRAENEALRSLCAAAYQVVGAADGPVEMLDNLAAATIAMALPHEPHAGLPWTPNVGAKAPT